MLLVLTILAATSFPIVTVLAASINLCFTAAAFTIFKAKLSAVIPLTTGNMLCAKSPSGPSTIIRPPAKELTAIPTVPILLAAFMVLSAKLPTLVPATASLSLNCAVVAAAAKTWPLRILKFGDCPGVVNSPAV